jgi:hypothetical protein
VSSPLLKQIKKEKKRKKRKMEAIKKAQAAAKGEKNGAIKSEGKKMEKVNLEKQIKDLKPIQKKTDANKD